KQGFLRSASALIQTVGRAARHIEGRVIMYADKITDAMRTAIDETDRRRAKQQTYNEEHGIEPVQIVKQIRDITEAVRRESVPEAAPGLTPTAALASLPPLEMDRVIRDLEKQMKEAARQLEFEKAAILRDQIMELRETMRLRRDESSEAITVADYNW
ncbi:MAG: UvrB/UvrC motif-containing protein, partial [Anaerolineae bacterium]|nr:UvrB/UvrC motif-containing protein [Anaerolineae bacterium]